MLSQFVQDNPDDVSYIVYHGSDDPWYVYYAAKHEARFSYYGIQYIPHCHVDGVADFTPDLTQLEGEVLVRSLFNAPVEIVIDAYVSGSNVIANVTMNTETIPISGNNRLFIAIMQKNYTGWSGSNGLSEWHYDMLDMQPTGSGIPVEVEANSSHTETVDFMYPWFINGTQIDWDNLKVIAFVQNMDTRQVHNSNWVDVAEEGAVRQLPSENIPSEYTLEQNYPNPFNPLTSISFSLPSKSGVKLSVFDITGKEVVTLIDKDMESGSYSVNWDASDMPSGTYFYRISTSNFTQTKKMLLIK